MKKIQLIIVPFLMTLSLFAEGKIKLMKQYNYATKCEQHLEGFSKSIGGNDFSYHSLRIDATDALLTRCTNGEMAIEWVTQDVLDNTSQKGLWFTWLAAVQNTIEEHSFDVYINDEKKFEFISSNQEQRKFENEEGGILEFTTVEFDQHNDAHGYMSLYAPTDWIKNGEPLKIKIVGEAAGSNTWIIVYKANDVVEYLQDLVKYETWLNVSLDYDGKDSHLNFIAPVNYYGRQLNAQIGNDKYIVDFTSNVENAVAKIIIEDQDIRELSFKVRDDNSDLIDFPSLTNDLRKQKLLNKSLLINEVNNEGGITKVICERVYKPHTVSNLLKLSSSLLGKGQINLMNSSHQDIAWMDSPEKCVIERDTMLLTPLYEKAMQSDPNYRFDIEDALMLKEYIQRHPDRKEGITKLLKEGKITCGSSFIQPYEEMYSGESLVRQFYFGRKWLKDEFDYDANVYWNVDVPGKVLQMPQILKKSGTDYMVISRFEKGMYNWYSPDGSYITTYSPGHYADAFMPLHKNVFDAANYLAESSLFWERYYSDGSEKNVIPVLSDWDMSPAKDYSNVIQNWESINELEMENGKQVPIELPSFQICTAQEFLDNFLKNASNIPKINGERPPVWLYIHGPSHYQALKASREADILLTVAEKFSTIEALIENNFASYPEDRLNNAWEAKIYPDHGWGGKMGEITDNMFESKFKFARSEASYLTDRAINSIASKVKTKSQTGIPILVFNSLNWERTDIIEFELSFNQGDYRSIELVDYELNNIDYQLSDVSNYDDGTFKKVKICFVAEKVPSTGFKTYYVKKSLKENKRLRFNPYESDYYRVSLRDGGIESIYDKELGKEILDISNFLGGEIFTLKSEGHGAGEFADIQQPTLNGFDKTGNYKTNWKVLSNGPVYSSFKFRQQIRNAVVENEITIYKKLKRIDFDISLLNWEGLLYREYRMALPVNIKNGRVAYETPFGVVNVGEDELNRAAGERYTTSCKDIHPRGIENWISASNKSFGVTLSSCVAVADYIDPTDTESEQTILQPILLASRKSCHSEGNEYLQTGNHHFNFSLTSHISGWEYGFKAGKQANEKLFVIINPIENYNAFLPEEKSFYSVDKENVIISTIKKAEDDNSVVVRLYDVLGTDEQIELITYKDIQNAIRTNLIEEGNEKLKSTNNSVSLKLGKYSIETLKLINSP